MKISWIKISILSILILLFSTTINAQTKSPSPSSSASKKQKNWMVLVDTSGSMKKFYQKNLNRPSDVVELLQRLVLNIMKEGDNLTIIPFDAEIYDDPDKMFSLRKLKKRKALRELERIKLDVHDNPKIRGTVRSAAIGRSLRVLDQFASSDPEFARNETFIILLTDIDRDVKDRPKFAMDIEYKEKAEKKKLLIPHKSKKYGNFIIEIFKYRLSPKQSLDSSLNPDLIISDLEVLFKPYTIGKGEKPDITSITEEVDFQTHSLNFSLEPFKKEGEKEYKSNAILRSDYEVLSFRGEFEFKGNLYENGQKSEMGRVVLDPPSDSIMLGSRKSIGKKSPIPNSVEIPVKLILDKKLPFTAMNPVNLEVVIKADLKKGALCSNPEVFKAADPKATALSSTPPRKYFELGNKQKSNKMTGTQHLITDLESRQKIVLTPNRGIQIGGIIFLILLVGGAVYLFKKITKVTPINLYFKESGMGPDYKSFFFSRDTEENLDSQNFEGVTIGTVKRDGKSDLINLTLKDGYEIKDPMAPLTSRGGRLSIEGGSFEVISKTSSTEAQPNAGKSSSGGMPFGSDQNTSSTGTWDQSQSAIIFNYANDPQNLPGDDLDDGGGGGGFNFDGPNDMDDLDDGGGDMNFE